MQASDARCTNALKSAKMFVKLSVSLWLGRKLELETKVHLEVRNHEEGPY